MWAEQNRQNASSFSRGLVLLCVCITAGCGTPSLRRARREFYSGQVSEAEKTLSAKEVGEKNQILLLMERGTVRQAQADYEGSTKDYIHAADLIEQRLSYSLTQGATSMVVNDNVQDFLGEPYERTLLYTMTALSHLALGRWDDVAVGARRIIGSLSSQVRKEHPDIAFCRYLAGVAFELIDDPSNAALQYRLASELLETVQIDEKTGRPSSLPAKTNISGRAMAPEIDSSELPCELICILLTGRTTPGGAATARGRPFRFSPHAEIRVGDRRLGRTYALGDTHDMALTAQRLAAARKAIKTTTRIIMKDVAAETVGAAVDSEAIGELVRLILYLMEQPDIRRWETLPGRLHVARVPCPADLKSYRIVWLGGTHEVTSPIVRRGNIYVSVYRILPHRRTGNSHKKTRKVRQSQKHPITQ